MSEDHDVDIESDFDEDEDDDGSLEPDSSNTQFMTPAEKRAHHNALERKRRDHIKESFLNLRDAVPSLKGDKASKGSSASHKVQPNNLPHISEVKTQISRSQILKQATDYIQLMTNKNGKVQNEISELKRQNRILEQQVNAYERSRGLSGPVSLAVNGLSESSDGSEETNHSPRIRNKRMKTVPK